MAATQSASESTPRAEGRPKDGSRARPVGLFMILGGFIGYFIAAQLQNGAETQDTLLLWGLVAGVFGWLVIAGVITLIVGFVLGAIHRAHHR